MLPALGPRGILSGKVGTQMCGPDSPFFYLKSDFGTGRVFAKCLIFDESFLWFTYRL